MAEAYGKLTGRPGIAFVTRGPGASNAAIGIHTAEQDSTPMIVFIGQVGSDFVDREAFQEIDYRRMYGSIAKWAAQIDRAERIPEYVAHAYRVAMSGRPGPVVLALPEDMLTARATCADAPRVEAVGRAPAQREVATVRSAAGGRDAAAGAGRRQPLGCGRLRRAAFVCGNECAAGRLRVPHQDLFDNRHAQLRGRCRHRHQPEARGARARRRRAARHRRAAGRDDDRPATRCSRSRSRSSA